MATVAKCRRDFFFRYDAVVSDVRCTGGKIGLIVTVWLLTFLKRSHDMIFSIVRSFLLFLKNVLGCINNPYSTYRTLASNTKNTSHVYFIVLLVIGYFAFASAVRSGIRNPYLLTIQFNSLLLAAIIGFIGMTLLLYGVGRLFGVQPQIQTLVILWAYSLLPTILWFLATSALYVPLPPPRTISFWGKLYSMTFVTFSMGMLGWKIILYYLTMRFALRIDLLRIIMVSMIVVPVIIGYAVVMYRLGVMRIPFL